MTYYATITTIRSKQKTTTFVDAKTPHEAQTLINNKIKGFAQLTGNIIQDESPQKGKRSYKRTKAINKDKEVKR